MKRGAEEQLTKEREDGEDSEPEQGFVKADDSVLAKRVIKGLPKRANLGSPASTGPSTPTAVNGATEVEITSPKKFGGFTGFGAGGQSTTPFTFGSPSLAAPPATPHHQSNISTIAPAVPTPPTPSPANPFAKPPTVATTASSATKTFASFLSTSSVVAPPSAPEASSKTGSNESAVAYYKSIRGLNVSFLKTVQDAVEKDPFIDISDLLSQYTKMRVDIRRTSDSSTPAGGSLSPIGSKLTPAPSFSAPSMPAPPLTGFSLPTAVQTQAQDAPSNPPTAHTSSTFGSLKGMPSALASPFDFGTVTVPAKASASPSSTSTPTPLPFSFGSSSSATSATPALFSTSLINAGKEKSPADDTKSKPAPGFGSDTAKPAASIGFSFATSSPSPFGGTPFSSFSSSAGSPFGGGTSAFKTVHNPVSAQSSAGNVTETSTTGEDGDEATRSRSPPPNHDAEGKGEENENTTFSMRSKVYKLVKPDGAESGKQPSWCDLGVGILRLKKHKEKEVRRVLLRNSSTGRLIINFNLYAALSPVLDLKTKTVSFVGHDHSEDGQGKPASYKIRVKTEQDAKDLKEAFDREVQAVKDS